MRCGLAVARAVGGFPVEYFLYYEDTDLSWRLGLTGQRIRYAPDAVVHHLHSASSDQKSASFAFHNQRNQLLTVLRNAPLPLALASVGRFRADHRRAGGAAGRPSTASGPGIGCGCSGGAADAAGHLGGAAADRAGGDGVPAGVCRAVARLTGSMQALGRVGWSPGLLPVGARSRRSRLASAFARSTTSRGPPCRSRSVIRDHRRPTVLAGGTGRRIIRR